MMLISALKTAECILVIVLRAIHCPQSRVDESALVGLSEGVEVVQGGEVFACGRVKFPIVLVDATTIVVDEVAHRIGSRVRAVIVVRNVNQRVALLVNVVFVEQNRIDQRVIGFQPTRIEAVCIERAELLQGTIGMLLRQLECGAEGVL